MWVTAVAVFHTQSASGQLLLGASLPKKNASPARSAATDTRSGQQRGKDSAVTANAKAAAGVWSTDDACRLALKQLAPTVRKVIIWQAALDRAGFSPGIIDGRIGPKTRAGLRAFQKAAGLPVTGKFDSATGRGLGIDTVRPLVRYVLTDADAALVGACPNDWVAKSKARWLGFESPAAVASFRGHCSRKLLAELNAGTRLEKLKAGDALVLPNVAIDGKTPKARSVRIDFGTKTIVAFDRRGRPVALFHCSIARQKRHRPSGPCKVASITLRPKYLFKPESWPEVKGVHRRLVIPPGPRNPVGLCWIGLSIRGYGIHGTPQTELIGWTGSHGCFRLSNWDALRLATILRVGVPVRFIDSSAKLARGG